MATDKLSERVAKQLAGQIEQGIYLPGDRLPGVRRLARQFETSISTIVQAQLSSFAMSQVKRKCPA